MIASQAISCFQAEGDGTDGEAYTYKSYYLDLATNTAPVANDYVVDLDTVTHSNDGYQNKFVCESTFGASSSDYNVITCHVFQRTEADSAPSSYRFDKESD